MRRDMVTRSTCLYCDCCRFGLAFCTMRKGENINSAARMARQQRPVTAKERTTVVHMAPSNDSRPATSLRRQRACSACFHHHVSVFNYVYMHVFNYVFIIMRPTKGVSWDPWLGTYFPFDTWYRKAIFRSTWLQNSTLFVDIISIFQSN